MRHPRLRSKLATAVLAALAIAAVVLAVPGRSASDRGPQGADGQRSGRIVPQRPGVVETETEQVSPELAAPRFDPPLPAQEVQRAAEAAGGFALAYATRRHDERAAARAARLQPLLTDRAAGQLLAAGSTGLAELDAQRRRRETASAQLAFLQPIEVTSDRATYLVAVTVTVHAAGQPASPKEHVYTLTLLRDANGWLVDEFALS